MVDTEKFRFCIFPSLAGNHPTFITDVRATGTFTSENFTKQLSLRFAEIR